LPFATRRQIVLHFVRSIEVVDHKMLRIRFQVPFDNNGIRVLTDDGSKDGADDGAGPDVSSCYPVVSSNCAGRPTTGSQSRVETEVAV
ncbi:hypothetical protein KJ567_07270, partial [Candidatus Bipolaricaulota bacterium]|nr:hypothetical protein [Candidatus Bipolaricaulota bacterium]